MHNRDIEWVTRENEKIKLRDLTDVHLTNIINMLKRQEANVEEDVRYYPSFRGEMAQYYAEQAWDTACAQQLRIQSILRLMEAERDYRACSSDSLQVESV